MAMILLIEQMFYWMLQRWLVYLSPCFEALFTSTLPGGTSAIYCSIWKSITGKTNDYLAVKIPPSLSGCSSLESSQHCLQITGLCLCWLLCSQHNDFFFGIDLHHHHEMLALNSINILWSLHSTLMHIIEGSWHWNWGQWKKSKLVSLTGVLSVNTWNYKFQSHVLGG